MKTSNFRHKVFCMAYELMRTTGKAFAVCLSRAWALYRLTKQMHRGIVTFAYEKADGSLRRAKGTLKDVQSLIKVRSGGRRAYLTRSLLMVLSLTYTLVPTEMGLKRKDYKLTY